MRKVVKSLDCCCCKIEIFVPSVSKDQIELMVQFLYNGQFSDLGAEVFTNLVDLLGFPKSMQITKGAPVFPVFMQDVQGIS